MSANQVSPTNCNVPVYPKLSLICRFLRIQPQSKLAKIGHALFDSGDHKAAEREQEGKQDERAAAEKLGRLQRSLNMVH